MINGSIDDTQHRRLTLSKIVMDFKRQGKQITRYALQPELKKVGFSSLVSYFVNYVKDLTKKKTAVVTNPKGYRIVQE